MNLTTKEKICLYVDVLITYISDYVVMSYVIMANIANVTQA